MNKVDKYLIIILGNDTFELSHKIEAVSFEKALAHCNELIKAYSKMTIEQLRIGCIKELC